MGKVVKNLFDAEGNCAENGLARYSRVGGSRHWQCHSERRTVGSKSKDLVKISPKFFYKIIASNFGPKFSLKRVNIIEGKLEQFYESPS
jgi:hypothetical protein